MQRYGLARDGNEREIVTALRQAGAHVIEMHTPCDLLVGYRRQTFLIEIKRPLGPRGGLRGSILTPQQRKIHKLWRGAPILIVRTPTEALEAIGAIRP